jgi:hypothetical protein
METQPSLFKPLFHHDNCNQTAMLESRKFSDTIITYCTECFRIKFTPIECDHKYITMLVENSNGATHVRRFCNKCHYLQHGIKKSEFTAEQLIKLPKRTLEEVNAFKDSIPHDNIEQGEFIRGMHIKQSEYNFNVRHNQYEEYLNSSDWKYKRDIIMARYNRTCQICGDRAIDVHHITYEHIQNEYPFELVPLCRQCHKNWHDPLFKKPPSDFITIGL